MKFKLSKLIWSLIILSLIGTAAVYPILPQYIPMHWNISGEINRYGEKYSIFITAALPLILYLFAIVIPKIDPKRESYEKHGKAFEVLISLIVIFLIMMNWITVAVSLGYKINITIIMNASLGILFLVIGNYMRQIRFNYFFGIRTPWTLANEKVWTRTHRLGSIVYIIGGLLFITGAIINNKYFLIFCLIYLIGSSLYLFIYSYIIYRQLNN